MELNNQIKPPRIKKGKITVAYKEGNQGGKADFLITNTYFSTFLQKKPLYWDKLLDLLYQGGRLNKYASMVEDIVDKFSFLFLSRDKICHYEAQMDPSKMFYIKYFTYAFVYFTKSFLDSLSVFINDIYELGYEGGDIDLKKKKFIDGIAAKHKEFAELVYKRKKWIDKVIRYRDNLIHKHSLCVGPLPIIPPEITDEKEISVLILKEPFYLPNDPDLVEDILISKREGEFIKLSCFVNEWINESADLLDIVLGTFTHSFTRASWQRKDEM